MQSSYAHSHKETCKHQQKTIRQYFRKKVKLHKKNCEPCRINEKSICAVLNDSTNKLKSVCNESEDSLPINKMKDFRHDISLFYSSSSYAYLKKHSTVLNSHENTNYMPNKTWGAIVDPVWMKQWYRFNQTERELMLILRKRKAAKQNAIFSPSWNRSNALSKLNFHTPGSGSFKLDKLRKKNANKFISLSDGFVHYIAPINLKVVLNAFLKENQSYFPSLDKLEEDILHTQIKAIFDLDVLSFNLIAELFYSQNWWISIDLLEKYCKINTESKQLLSESIENLIRKGLIKGEPDTLEDALDLFNTFTKSELAQSKWLYTNSSFSKRSALINLKSNGLSYSKTILVQINKESLRLTDFFFKALQLCHVWMFATMGYSCEDTKCLLSHNNLNSIRFVNSSCSGTPKMVSYINDFYQTKDLTLSRLIFLELRANYFSAINLTESFDECVEIGDTDGAFSILHKVSDRLIELNKLFSADNFYDQKFFKLPQQLILELKVLCCICLNGCNLFERSKNYNLALHYLEFVIQSTTVRTNEGCLHHLPGMSLLHSKALLRRIRDLEHCNRKNEALSTVEKAFDQLSELRVPILWPSNETKLNLGGHGFSLIQFLKKLSVPPLRWKPLIIEINDIIRDPTIISIKAKYAHQNTDRLDQQTQFGRKKRNFRQWEGNKTVEELVIDHFFLAENGGWEGIHCENGFALTLFSLIMWDLIWSIDSEPSAFCELPFEFRHSTWLAQNHKLAQKVQERINTIMLTPAPTDKNNAFAIKMVRQSWEKYYGLHIRGLNWDIMNLSDFEFILQGLQSKVVAMICALYAENYKAWCGGLPDLMLWRKRDTTETQGRISEVRFIEVKGPGDHLSCNQKAWINKLKSAGADICVCHVVSE